MEVTQVILEFLYYILCREAEKIAALGTGMTYPEVSCAKIPLPPLKKQQQLAARLQKRDAAIDNLREKINGAQERKRAALERRL